MLLDILPCVVSWLLFCCLCCCCVIVVVVLLGTNEFWRTCTGVPLHRNLVHTLHFSSLE